MKKEFIIIHEGLMESWLKDFVSFGTLFFMLYANHVCFGDHAIVALAFVAMMILIMAAKVGKNLHNFYEKEEAKKFIDTLN